MGIFGQIGMMLLTGGIANAAFGALSTMAGGFMQGLSTSTSMIGKMAYSTLTGIKTIVAAPLKIGSSVFKNVTKGAFQAIKDVGMRVGNVISPGTPFKTTGGMWDSLGKIGTKYGGNIVKDTSAALGDVKNFAFDAIGKGPIKSNFKTFTPAGGGDAITKNLSYDTSAAEQFRSSKEYATFAKDLKSTYVSDLAKQSAQTPIPTAELQSKIANFENLQSTKDKLNAFGTPKPVGSLLTRARTGAVTGFQNTFSTTGLATTGGTALTQKLYGSSMATDAPVDTSLQIQPTKNLFGRNLQEQVATPRQFFSGFINNPQEAFSTPDFQPLNYNQWMIDPLDYKSSSYV